MADVEYKGVHLTGIKGSYLFVLLPLFGSIIGGLWGGFELYKRYEDMEKQIQAYVAPDLSGFDKRLSIFDTQLKDKVRFVDLEVSALKELVQDAQETARDIRTDIKGDIGEQADQISAIDKRSRADGLETRQAMRGAESEIRDLITQTSKRWDDKLTKVDSQIENLEKKIDKKITKALENPLAAMSKSNSVGKKFPWKVQK
jgi:predicted  nucleic acid-binding Zn-ribbon protein